MITRMIFISTSINPQVMEIPDMKIFSVLRVATLSMHFILTPLILYLHVFFIPFFLFVQRSQLWFQASIAVLQDLNNISVQYCKHQLKSQI